jgi:hypothetical protein
LIEQSKSKQLAFDIGKIREQNKMETQKRVVERERQKEEKRIKEKQFENLKHRLKQWTSR